MPTSDIGTLLALAAFMACGPSAVAQTIPAAGHYGIGRAATPAQVRSWDIDISPDGKNLPAGSGTVAQGKAVYDAQCAACHGAQGQGGLGDKLVGGQGTLTAASPVRTVGSYWPYATTLYDYIRRAMPLTAPQSLTNDEVYAVSGYVLFLNGLVSDRATIDAKALTDLRMPNRDGFIGDARPDVQDAGCTKDCAR